MADTSTKIPEIPPMIDWAKDLFPICRSLTGAGVTQTLQYIKNIHSELNVQTFKTGHNVFDWQIPKEWNIEDAYIEHESGKKFAEFNTNNLHVVGYSTPVDTELELDELVNYIHTEADQPDVIPYVTSYYKERWGFCLTENEKRQLPAGKYRAVIKSELQDGELQVADIKLPGKKQKEIFFSTYICHPSMANNELSGPVLATALALYIKNNYSNSSYSYRFVFVPETIGSLAYMSEHLADMQSKIICGFNLSCVGDERSYSHVESPHGDNLADTALRAGLLGKTNSKTYSFLHRGSDERQYCAPGIDLPVCGFCRTKYGEYPEYHTSADDFSVVTQEGLAGSFEVMTSIIDAFEFGLYPKTAVLGEPQLGKRNLYPTVSQKGSTTDIRIRMDLLAYSNGKMSVFDIAMKINQPLRKVLREIRILADHELLIFEDD